MPLCIFDEVEAALDQANVERFAKYIARFRGESQFIVVTHRPRTAVELYATTLHYAPCSVGDAGFRCGIVLPKDTNLPLDSRHAGYEDALITAKNKWLIGHAEGGLDAGSHIGLIGENISV